MRILAFTPWGSMVGGANKSFMMVIKGLRESGYNVMVVVPEDGTLTETLSASHIPVTVFSSPTEESRRKGNLLDLLRILKITVNSIIGNHKSARLTNLLGQQFDLVYINCSNQLTGLYYANRAKLPVVWHIRDHVTGQDIHRKTDWRKMKTDKNHYIAISYFVAESLSNLYGIPRNMITVIHNGLDYQPEEKKQIDKGEIHILIAGTIKKIKGQHEAVRAVSILIQKGYPIVFHIAGSPVSEDDPYYSSLLKLVDDLGVAESIVFEGYVEHLSRLRAGMQYELICSENEPFGRITVEAMLSRCCVIAANTGGTLEIIQDGVTGFLYQQGSPSALAQKIEERIENPSETSEVVERAFDYAANAFSAEKNIAKVQAVLQNAAKMSGVK